MCGIAGVIGNSKDPKISFEIMSLLFEKIETRGKDASGFWGISKNDSVLFCKEPLPSSDFIKKNDWQFVKNQDPCVMICHAREASKGVGLPEHNENNHPFVNDNQNIAVVHNGRIPDSKYFDLKDKFLMRSECDSELFLRMFEGDFEVENYIEDRIETIKNIWDTLFDAHMAVVIGEVSENEKRIWIFRNEYRTLWQADARKQLGQIFFVSTREIWDEATENIPVQAELSEFETSKLYLMKMNKNHITYESFVM